MHRTALSAFIVLMLLPSGCVFETAMDMTVYFDNTTDQTFYLWRQDQLDRLEEYFLIYPNRTTHIGIIGRGECRDWWVITKKDGTLVKDPGEVCWHDTITIP